MASIMGLCFGRTCLCAVCSKNCTNCTHNSGFSNPAGCQAGVKFCRNFQLLSYPQYIRKYPNARCVSRDIYERTVAEFTTEPGE